MESNGNRPSLEVDKDPATRIAELEAEVQLLAYLLAEVQHNVKMMGLMLVLGHLVQQQQSAVQSPVQYQPPQQPQQQLNGLSPELLALLLQSAANRQ